MLAHFRRQGVAYLALFVALSGTGYAAANLPKNSVSGKQVKNGSITTKDIKDGTVAKADLAAGAAGVPGPAGSAGPVGPVFGFSASNGTNITPDSSPGLTSFTLPVAGKVFVSVSLQSLGATCSAGNWTAQLIVDGAPVPGAWLVAETSGISLRDVTMTGVTSSALAVGTHTIKQGFDCTSGTLTGTSTALTGFTTVVLGS